MRKQFQQPRLKMGLIVLGRAKIEYLLLESINVYIVTMNTWGK